MNFDNETLKEQFPPYLTAENRNVLLRDLEALTQSKSVELFLSNYNNEFQSEMLQGDGWRGFQIFSFNSGKTETVDGIVISNSCSIDPSNKHEIPTRVAFAPLIKLSALKRRLDESNLATKTVEDKIKSMKSQDSFNIFFIPKGGHLDEDCIARFDEIYSMPIEHHQKHPDRKKLFTLNQTGFYLFVFKLSIHFCRLNEGIIRENNSTISK